MKRISIVIGLAAVFWLAWPFYTLWRINDAVREGDEAALESFFEWPSVRAGLRDDMNVMLIKDLTPATDKDGPANTVGNGFAALLGPMLVERMVEAYVTPRAVAEMLRTARAVPVSQTTALAGATTMQRSANEGIKWESVRYAFFAGDLVTFQVDLNSPEGERKQTPPMKVLMRWSGGWRITRIFLPLDGENSSKSIRARQRD